MTIKIFPTYHYSYRNTYYIKVWVIIIFSTSITYFDFHIKLLSWIFYFYFYVKTLLCFVINNTNIGRISVNREGHGINKYYKSTRRKKQSWWNKSSLRYLPYLILIGFSLMLCIETSSMSFGTIWISLCICISLKISNIYFVHFVLSYFNCNLSFLSHFINYHSTKILQTRSFHSVLFYMFYIYIFDKYLVKNVFLHII